MASKIKSAPATSESLLDFTFRFSEHKSIWQNDPEMIIYSHGEEYKAEYENVYLRANLTGLPNMKFCSTNSAANDPIYTYCRAEDRGKVNPGKFPICEPCVAKLLTVNEWKKMNKKGRKTR